MNVLKKYWQNDLLFFSGLFLLVLFFFHGAFSITFFSDDLFFLKISRVHTLTDWLYFFVPGKDYFFRPIPSEFFYWLIHLTNNNLLVAHGIVFVVYFIGLIYLYKSLQLIFKNTIFSRVALLLYSIHLVHVFQLYYLATFQEIAMFTFLAISFYGFITNRKWTSWIFFTLALMSKETALFYPLFLLVFTTFQHLSRQKKIDRPTIIRLMPYLGMAFIFGLIFKYSLSKVAQIDIYQVQYNYHLFVNNYIWYTLWSLGLPNVMPLYMVSLLKPPTPEFFNLFAIVDFQKYFILMSLYWIFMITTSVWVISRQQFKIYSFQILIAIISFSLFISPALLIIHRWMVRLTIPLIFVSLLQAGVLAGLITKSKLTKALAILLIAAYLLWNFFGTKFHESSSLYVYETEIAQRANQFFSTHYNKIINRGTIYFKDSAKNHNVELRSSSKLYTSFSDQSFIDFYFPGKKVKAIYNFQQNSIPKGSFIINSAVLLGN